jgi:two-component system response regulator DegU
MKIKVLVVDDSQVIRAGIEMMLQNVREIQLVGFVCNGTEALNLITQKSPDILVLDVEMPDIDGLTLTRQIVKQKIATKVIILSAHQKVAYVINALDAGARGYLPKNVDLDELVWSIQLVYRGYSAFKTDLLEKATTERELLFEKCRERVSLLEEDLYRQQLKPPKRSLFRKIVQWFRKTTVIKFLFLPIIYLRKNKSFVKLKQKVNLVIFNSIERTLKYCDRFWNR